MTDHIVKMFQGILLILMILGMARSQGKWCGDEAMLIDGRRTEVKTPYVYLQAYNTDLNCTWTLTTWPDKRIKMYFDEFSLQDHPTCGYDSLTVYDGPNASFPILDILCGSFLPDYIISSASAMLVQLTTDHTEFFRIFDLSITAVEKWCGDEAMFIDQDAELIPPRYSSSYQNYRPHLICTWRLTTWPGKRIRIHFRDFSVEYHPTCVFDSLSVYDGPNASLPEMEVLCGHYQPPEIVSSASSMSLQFTTDRTISSRGFDIHIDTVDLNYTTTTTTNTITTTMTETTSQFNTTWNMDTNSSSQLETASATNLEPPCHARISVIPIDARIESPGFPSNYTNNLDCVWQLSTPGITGLRVYFFSMDVEDHPSCIHDSVSFYDGPSDSSPLLGKFCGNAVPPAFKTSGQFLLVVFHTDDSIIGQGFRLSVSRGDRRWYTPTPGHPNTTNMMDSTTTQTSQPDAITASDSTNTTSCPAQDLLITQPTNITSPGYPSNYVNNLDCQWILRAPANSLLRISFLFMDLEYHSSCDYDFISFHGDIVEAAPLSDSLCGDTLPLDVISEGQHMEMVFHTDSSITGGGFNLQVSLEEAGLQELAVGNAVLLSSPNFPFANYGHNQDLTWTFTASPNEIVSIYFLEFEMEGDMPGCPSDSVIIYDGSSHDSEEIGTFCGHYVQGEIMISSTGPTVFLQYLTDGSISDRGFNVLFVPIDTEVGSHSNEDNGEGCTYVPTAMYADTPGMVVWCDHHCALGYCPVSHCLQVC